MTTHLVLLSGTTAISHRFHGVEAGCTFYRASLYLSNALADRLGRLIITAQSRQGLRQYLGTGQYKLCKLPRMWVCDAVVKCVLYSLSLMAGRERETQGREKKNLSWDPPRCLQGILSGMQLYLLMWEMFRAYSKYKVGPQHYAFSLILVFL